MKARLALLATFCVVAVLNACGSPTNLRANNITTVDTLAVFALSGTPPSYPSGVSIVARQPVRVDGFGGFDVAFDIDANGRAVIYPVKLVVTALSGTRAVGLQKVPGTFETVTEAPRNGYETDSARVLLPGEVVVLQAVHNFAGDVCSFALSPNLYAKMEVESIDLATRTLTIQMGLDPNCGFRSFVAGIPTS